MPPLLASAGLAGRLGDVRARGRAADALRAVAVDLLRPAAREQLPSDDWDRLCSIVHGPVDLATDRALAVLLIELEKVVQEAGPSVVEQHERYRSRILLGTD